MHGLRHDSIAKEGAAVARMTVADRNDIAARLSGEFARQDM